MNKKRNRRRHAAPATTEAPAATPAAQLWAEVSPEDAYLIGQIIHRARYMMTPMTGLVLDLDEDATRRALTVCHMRACPLRLYDLLNAEPHDLLHDVVGIQRHIDLSKGELSGEFLPRFSAHWHPCRLDPGHVSPREDGTTRTGWLRHLMFDCGLDGVLARCDHEGRELRCKGTRVMLAYPRGKQMTLHLALELEQVDTQQ